MTEGFVSPPIPASLPVLKSCPRLAVLASGNGSNLGAIAAAIAQSRLQADLKVVIYNVPDAKVKEKALQHRLPAVLLDHRSFETREHLDEAIIKTARQYQVDWLIMAGWMRRVTQTLISAFPNRILNIHPSLLPSFPGTRAVEQALQAKVKISGCTVHFVELEVDCGPIVMQAAVPVYPGDTAKTLHGRIQVQEHIIYPAAISMATSGSVTAGEKG